MSLLRTATDSSWLLLLSEGGRKFVTIAYIHCYFIASSPSRIEIQNFKVQFALDERLQMKFDASWDSTENAKDYLLTVSRIEDCVPNELSWVTNQTSLVGTWNGFDLAKPSTFLFDVRVNSNINASDTIRPKARQLRKPVRSEYF